MNRLLIAAGLTGVYVLFGQAALVLAAFSLNTASGYLTLIALISKNVCDMLVSVEASNIKKQKIVTNEIEQILNETGVREH